jgi:hypothetical protein
MSDDYSCGSNTGAFPRRSMPANEGKLKRVTIGEPSMLNGPIALAEYNAEWPEHFACQAKRIQTALGDRALRIEHIGSTSVPGLAAKPVIDILLVVRMLNEFRSRVGVGGLRAINDSLRPPPGRAGSRLVPHGGTHRRDGRCCLVVACPRSSSLSHPAAAPAPRARAAARIPESERVRAAAINHSLSITHGATFLGSFPALYYYRANPIPMSDLKFSWSHCEQHLQCDEQLAGRQILVSEVQSSYQGSACAWTHRRPPAAIGLDLEHVYSCWRGTAAGSVR